MASATDIITYIGVPLAVLGVTPIFYTFLSALYTRLKLGRMLRKNGIECPIRARLMTGAVEVDLPVYHLDVLFRDEPSYWLPSTSVIRLDGASWTCHNFHKSIYERNTVRVQRSDKVILPAAEISFKSLLDYLLDRGYTPNEEGFRALQTRRQQTSEGTVLMNTKSGASLLFAKPGYRHGSITLEFSEQSSLTSHLLPSYCDSTNSLPPFHLTGPLLEGQYEGLSANDIATPTNEEQNSSANATGTHTTTEKRRYFVMKWARLVGLELFGLEITIHETPAPSRGIELPHDHILSRLHPYKNGMTDRNPWGEHLNWFACAAIAVYGFDLETPKSFYIFPPNERFLHSAQWYDIEFSAVMLHGLVHPDILDLDGSLGYVDFDQYDIASANRSGNSRQTQSTNRSTREWITRRDLKFIAHLETSLPKSAERWRMERVRSESNVIMRVLKKHIDMPNLLRMCIQSLLSHPIRYESLSIGSLPQNPSGLDHITRHNADQILRMAILDPNFAEGVRARIHNLLKSPLAGALEAAKAGRKKSRAKESGVEDDDDILSLWASWFRFSQEETGLFCCAVVLLAVIGQRADYLRSGADMRQSVSDWPTVNLS